jgi:hypothetical protein
MKVQALRVIKVVEACAVKSGVPRGMPDNEVHIMLTTPRRNPMAIISMKRMIVPNQIEEKGTR